MNILINLEDGEEPVSISVSDSDGARLCSFLDSVRKILEGIPVILNKLEDD